MTVQKDIQITARYLCFPVAFSGREVHLKVLERDRLIKDISLWISPEYTCKDDRPGFIGWIDLSFFRGQIITLQGDMPEKWFEYVVLQNEKPEVYDRGERPQIHFTASQGWINDPNGLIVDQGTYHLFYQYNPFSKSWGNMHWGHASSTDLANWKEHDPAIYPDDKGVAFSGCAVTDSFNLSGLGENAMILYYTAFLQESLTAPSSQSTIRRCYSLDHGQSFQIDQDFHIKQITQGNRDPKIFFHQESHAWIMVLYLGHHEFAILRSRNLNDWSTVQRFQLEETRECPDLFKLEDPDTLKPHWIFSSGGGYYYIGDFDGYHFTNITGRKCASSTPLAYAAQTFFNTQNRIISLSWLRTSNFYSPYRGMMSLPKELSLTQKSSGLVLVQKFVQEIRDRMIRSLFLPETDRLNHVHIGGAFRLMFSIEQQSNLSNSDTAEVDILENILYLNFSKGTATIDNTIFRIPDQPSLDFDIFVDYGIIEILVNQGTIYSAVEYYFSSLTGNIRLTASPGHTFREIEIYDLANSNDEQDMKTGGYS